MLGLLIVGISGLAACGGGGGGSAIQNCYGSSGNPANSAFTVPVTSTVANVSGVMNFAPDQFCQAVNASMSVTAPGGIVPFPIASGEQLLSYIAMNVRRPLNHRAYDGFYAR